MSAVTTNLTTKLTTHFKICHVLLLAAIATQLCSSMAFAKIDTTCKVKTTDIGTIVGTGRSHAAAFEDAATKCFDRRADLFERQKGHRPDEDSGLVMIDLCANIKCEG